MWSDQLTPDWTSALAPADAPLRAAEAFLDAEDAAGRSYLPDRSAVLRAFGRPLRDVRVLLVGQDPYPTPGHAVGLSFAVASTVRPLPRSLRNIYVELEADLGVPAAAHGDLTAWFAQGVLLLNRVLSVAPGQPGSHRRRGWEQVTARAVEALAERGGPLVALLWGNDARKLVPLLGSVPVVQSAHPSPLSARAGFFGSRPFSRVNALLAAQGAAPIDWRLPAAPEAIPALAEN